jgi:NitT/TauT family transport system substrate-binding protein
VVIAKELPNSDPQLAAAITRALIRGARFVGENPDQAADLAISKGLWRGSKEALVNELTGYMWMPGVSHAKEHLRYYIHEGIDRGVYGSDLDEKTIFERVFIGVLPDLN